MTFLFFIILGLCKAATKGPRPEITEIVNNLNDDIATTHSSYFVDYEEMGEQFLEIVGALTKQDKAHRIIYINNADRFDSSSAAEISTLRTSLVDCAIKNPLFYIVILILTTFFILILFLTVYQLLFLKRKRSDECERFIVNTE